MEYEPCVNKLKEGDFTLFRADIFFSWNQQYDYYGRQVAYDGRIINGRTPRVSNSRLSILLPRSEELSQEMHPMPANRLQKQSDQLPMRNHNPSVLNSDRVQ